MVVGCLYACSVVTVLNCLSTMIHEREREREREREVVSTHFMPLLFYFFPPWEKHKIVEGRGESYLQLAMKNIKVICSGNICLIASLWKLVIFDLIHLDVL